MVTGDVVLHLKSSPVMYNFTLYDEGNGMEQGVMLVLITFPYISKYIELLESPVDSFMPSLCVTLHILKLPIAL